MTPGLNIKEERERARRAAAGVEGWLSEPQGEALFEVAAGASGRGHIVEIGSWKGRSTVWLAHGARVAGQRVHAIDRHEGSHEDSSARTFDQFLANLRRTGIEDHVVPMVMSSADAAAQLHGDVEVLFIDGDHSDAGSRSDADLWLPRLMVGGVVLMHDVATAGYTGPRRVFREQICRSPAFASIRRVGSMGIATRVRQRTVIQAAWGRTAGYLLYLLDLKRWLRKGRRT